jgi:hypothetical protein
MNTTFHMTGIKHAYSSLALTSRSKTLHVRIGSQHLEIPMVSYRAVAAAMQQLRQATVITPEDAIRICTALNESDSQRLAIEPQGAETLQAGPKIT